MAHTVETPAARRARMNNAWTEPPEPWTPGKPTPSEARAIMRWLAQARGLPRLPIPGRIETRTVRALAGPTAPAQLSPRALELVQAELAARHLTPLPWPEVYAPNSVPSLVQAIGALALRLPPHQRPHLGARGLGFHWCAAERRADRRPPFPFPVNAAQSEDTIHGSPAANHAFRAWHDALRLELRAGFTEDDELRVAEEHQRVARRAGLDSQDLAYLWADTRGQDLCKRRIGRFPKQQARYVTRVLAVGLDRAIEEERDA